MKLFENTGKKVPELFVSHLFGFIIRLRFMKFPYVLSNGRQLHYFLDIFLVQRFYSFFYIAAVAAQRRDVIMLEMLEYAQLKNVISLNELANVSSVLDARRPRRIEFSRSQACLNFGAYLVSLKKTVHREVVKEKYIGEQLKRPSGQLKWSFAG